MKPLVGQGKPFHSAVDKTAALLKRRVGTGAEFMKELMGITGIKPTELQERGLTEIMGMPRMTHDQFMANLSIRPAPKIREKVLGGDRSEPDSEAPYHGKWTLPNGDNYREMLIKAPKGVDNQEKIMELEAKLRHTPMFNSTPQQQADIAKYYNQIKDLKAQEAASPKPFPGVGAHFGGEPGILASMRLKDRTGPNGEKLLHLEELQSDWHQQGREKGYKSNAPEEEVRKAYNAQEYNAVPFDELRPEDRAHEIKKFREQGVPDAPFKKNWEEMALKRLIHHAAEKGYHGVVVTPGAEQAKRYSIGNHLHTLEHYPETGELRGYDKEGNRVVDEKNVFDKNIADYIGKEGAEKLRQAPAEKNGQLRVLEGADLHYGGKGMKAFYDTKVPNILNSIGKKYGVKTQMGGHRLKGSPEDYGNAVEKLGIAHIPMAQLTPEQNQKIAETADKRLHHFPITEEMRKDVLTNGLPLYADGGSIRSYATGSSVIKDTSKTVQPKAGGLSSEASQAKAEASLASAQSFNPSSLNAFQTIALALAPPPFGILARLAMMSQKSAEGPASTPAQAATQSSNADSPGSTASKADAISNAVNNNLGILSSPSEGSIGNSVGEGIGIGSGATGEGSTGVASNASIGAQATGMTSGPSGPAGAVGEGGASSGPGTSAGSVGASAGGAGGAGGGTGCCFIMLEARYGDGTIDRVVRRYRDEKMTDKNRRGYYKLAEVFVPLMRKSKLFKFVIIKTFADPLVSYGKYYYGENRWGWIFKPLERFWLGLFDTLGTEIKFIRENGEVV